MYSFLFSQEIVIANFLAHCLSAKQWSEFYFAKKSRTTLDFLIMTNILKSVTIYHWTSTLRNKKYSISYKFIPSTEHIPTDARPINWKIAENKLSNNTDCYDQTELVVRRASHFSIQGHFTRELNEAGDTLGFELKTGNKPNIKAGTLVRIEAKFEEKINEDSWSATSSVAGMIL